MQKTLSILLVLALCDSPIFADAILSPELQAAMNQERGELPIILSLKKDLTTEGVRSTDKNQILDFLAQQSEADQHFVNSLCAKLQGENGVNNVVQFKMSNCIAMTATAEAVRELAMHSDIYAIILDAPQQMINPIAATEETRATWGLNWIRASQNKGYKGDGVTVAVVDTGIQQNHPGFAAGQVLVSKGMSFVSGESSPNDGNGHGTHCAGTIASPQYGVAPGAKLIAVKVLGASGSGTWQGVAQGVEYGAQVADVLSMSLGGTESSSVNPVETAVRNATNAGVVCAIAAGNSGPGSRTIGTPGNTKEVITVGAISDGGSIAYFSSRGPTMKGNIKPDIVAPGVNVLSLWIGSGTNSISGTSMATPHVAGLCAVLLSANSGLSPQAIKNILMQTAKGTAQDNVYGKGCIDVPNSLNATLAAMDMGIRGDMNELRLEKTIEVDIIDGQVSFEKSIYAPFEVTITGMKANFSCANAHVTLGGKVIKDGAVVANQKETLNLKVGEGDHAVIGKASNTSIKSGKGEITVYISLW
jgi:hypothetical protein